MNTATNVLVVEAYAEGLSEQEANDCIQCGESGGSCPSDPPIREITEGDAELFPRRAATAGLD